jgi:hypothetical protein
MSWIGYPHKGFLHLFRRRRSVGRDWGRLLRGVERSTRSMIRSARPRRYRRGCCCCPAFLMLGLAGVGLIAEFLYLGIRFLGWA